MLRRDRGTRRDLPGARDTLTLITLSVATDADGDALAYDINGVTQDECMTGVGDGTFPLPAAEL